MANLGIYFTDANRKDFIILKNIL